MTIPSFPDPLTLPLGVPIIYYVWPKAYVELPAVIKGYIGLSFIFEDPEIIIRSLIGLIGVVLVNKLLERCAVGDPNFKCRLLPTLTFCEDCFFGIISVFKD